jgi:hypothetical protein
MTLLLDESYDLKKINDIDPPLAIDDSIILCLDPKSKNFNKNIVKACKDGFKYPVMSTKIFDKDKDYPHFFMYLKYNHKTGVINPEWKKVLSCAKFVLKNFITINGNTQSCMMWITLDKKALDYLHDYTKKFKFKSGADMIQKEITGKFSSTPVSETCVLITVDEQATDTGGVDEAGYFDTVASFHSHPNETYKKYNVCAAWPSVDDYVTVLAIFSEGYGAFHIVSTVEGLYVIAISDTLLKLPRETIREDIDKYEVSIRKNYKIDYPTECSNNMSEIYKYVDEINKKPYFTLKFVTWKDASKPIQINFKNTDGNCLLSDEQVKLNMLLKNKV